VGIAAVAVARCVITFAPQVVFDVDPALDPTPLAGLGPAGSLMLDALLLAACGCGLLGETLTGRSIDRRLLALALIPVPVVLWHGMHDLGDLWRGSTWVAAAAACVVVAHLGRDRALRVVLIALLAAVLVPIGVRGATQSAFSIFGWSLVGFEHADTIAEFEVNRDAFFADRGWAPDSPTARIYERRLRQPDPRGWFPTVNLFASIMAFGLVLCVGLLVASARNGRSRGWIVGLSLATAVVAGGLLAAGSKGALLSAMAGLAVLLVPVVVRPFGPARARVGGAVPLGLVAAALAAVVARGTLLPESFLGDRSLLFRWHYLVGSVRVIQGHGLPGVGPDGFQSAYTAVRLPRSPEEVTSAHSMFADWISTLGPSGLAWVGLVGLLLVRAGRNLVEDEVPAQPAAPPLAQAPLVSAAVVAGLGLLPAIAVEAQALDSVAKEMARGLGVLGFVLAAAGLSRGLERTRPSSVDWALAAAAVALVIHGQIEMTFFDPGSVVWVMCVLGLAGAVGAKAPPSVVDPTTVAASEAQPRPSVAGRPGQAWAGFVVAGALVVAALWVGGFRGFRALREQALMIEAAARLNPPAEDRQERVAQHETAGRLLTDAYRSHMPSHVGPLEEAARQFLIAAVLAEPPRRLELVDRAVALAEQAVADHGKPTSIALACEARRMRAIHAGSLDDGEAALAHARRLTESDPHGIGAWRRLGDLLWESGRRGEAAASYERALEADRNFELDELKRLSERDRQRLRERIEQGRRESP
jgi:hypothetical protein